MNELNGPNFSVSKVNLNGIQKQNSDTLAETQEDRVQITDFGDPKAEALGRSMLLKGADDTNNDLKALIENPQIAENSDKMFETAYGAAIKSGADNPYEEAAAFSTGKMS